MGIWMMTVRKARDEKDSRALGAGFFQKLGQAARQHRNHPGSFACMSRPAPKSRLSWHDTQRKAARTVLSLFLFLAATLLTGCSASSGEKQIFPVCMSMDKLADGRLQLAVQVSSMDSGETIFAAAGDSFEQALEILGASMPYPLHFGQLRLCIIGYSLAAESDLYQLLTPLYRLYTIRPDAAVMVSLGNAADTMAAQKPDLGVRMSTYLDQLLARLRQEKLTPQETLRDILAMLAAGSRDPLLGLCALNPSAAPGENSQTKNASQQQNPQNAASPAFSRSGRIAIGEPAPGADVPADMTAGALPRTGGNPVEYIGCVPVGNGRAAGMLAAQDVRLLLTLRQTTSIKDVTMDSAMVFLSQKGDITPEEAAQLVTILQQMHCDALGVTAAARKEASRFTQENESLSILPIDQMTLTITYK